MRKCLTIIKPFNLRKPSSHKFSHKSSLIFCKGSISLCLKSHLQVPTNRFGGESFYLHVLLEIRDWYLAFKATCHCVALRVNRKTKIEVRSSTGDASACAKKLLYLHLNSISWHFVERHLPFVDCCEVLNGWVEATCGVMKELASSKFGAISYISLRSNGRELEEGSIGKEVTNCVGIFGPIGCNINGGEGTRGMPPN